MARTSPDHGVDGGREEQSFVWVANYDAAENPFSCRAHHSQGGGEERGRLGGCQGREGGGCGQRV